MTLEEVVLFGIITFTGLCLTIGGYALHRGSLAFAGATAWLILGGFAIVESEGSWGIYMGLFWLCIGMLITSVVEGVLLNRGREVAEDEIEYGERIDEAMKDMDENIAIRRAKRRGTLK